MVMMEKDKKFIAHSLGRDFEIASNKVVKVNLFKHLILLLQESPDSKKEIRKSFEEGRKKEKNLS